MRIAFHAASGVLAVAAILTGTTHAANIANTVDKYGGFMDVKGAPGEFFSVQQINGRWWIVTPEGHGTFIRTVSKVDTNNGNVDLTGSGGYLSYDAVYLQPKDGRPTGNLKEAAANTLTEDVVDPGRGVTLKDVGDELVLGSERFKPNFTYFWLARLGAGGKLRWYYSTGKGWKLINGNGNPFAAVAQNADRSYSFDIGNFMAPDANGFGAWGNKRANKITWFEVARTGFPPDFAPMALPHDAMPRYYVKAVVTQAFTVAPVLNQTYERAIFDETAQRKYGPGDWNRAWAEAITQRLAGWGYNAVGMYSARYMVEARANLSPRLPGEPTWQISYRLMEDAKYHVKNVYSGAVFPPDSGRMGWPGVQPDAFDPMFEKGYMERVAAELPSLDTWSWALIPEEADHLFGLDNQACSHMGYVVLALNPYRATDRYVVPAPSPHRVRGAFNSISYRDPKVYAKYALRDFLRHRYKDKDEKRNAYTVDSQVPAYAYAAVAEGAELAAVENLNRAWGTRYTTWGTSTGDLDSGTNAWGKGTGFMDENGAGILARGARDASFKTQFTKAGFPAIRKDLDDFLGLFAQRYGKIVAKACAQGRHPPLVLPLYAGPDIVYKAIAPYVDGFWFSSRKPQEDALRIYNAAHKPVIVADYVTAEPDSPLYFKSRIEKVEYDPIKKRTIIYGPDIRYNFQPPLPIEFPGNAALWKAKAAHDVNLYPRVAAARWNTLEVAGDYTPYVKPGGMVALGSNSPSPDAPPTPATQEERAQRMIAEYDAVLNLRGDDGKYFVIGLEHWCLCDDGVNNGSENRNFGIATLQDNAYDGVEARRAAGRDSSGHPIGGEEADYGNLLGPLGKYLRSIPSQIRK